MERIPQGKYTPEFRAEAVKLVEQEKLSVRQAAKRLSVPLSSLDNRVRAARATLQAEAEVHRHDGLRPGLTYCTEPKVDPMVKTIIRRV
jgi:transposase-like protein